MIGPALPLAMDDAVSHPVILGSRSPQRRQLLSLIVPSERVLVDPPDNPEEENFDGLAYEAEIELRLREVARAKNESVVKKQTAPFAAVLTADTTIIGFEDVFDPAVQQALAFDDTGFDEESLHLAGRPHVLGQPPEENWQPVVREWFERFYLGRSHKALTAVCVARPDGLRREIVVSTDVHMAELVPGDKQLLDWYLATGEPLGKAGGYGIQGAAGIFVDAVRGSLSNVIGLPLRETLLILREFGAVP